jgi:hypothetical protein
VLFVPLQAAISTLVFVFCHLLIPGERQQKTFRDPGFLIMSSSFLLTTDAPAFCVFQSAVLFLGIC